MAKTPPSTLARGYHRSLTLRWLAAVLPMPALVPLLLGRGFDLAEVGLVLATFAAVTAALEVPTGGRMPSRDGWPHGRVAGGGRGRADHSGADGAVGSG
jgi:hypothetical protein